MSGPKAETAVVQRALAMLYSRYPRSTWWRQNSGKVKVRGGYMQLAPNGASDLVGVQEFGLAAFVEVKRKKVKLNDEQWKFLTEMQGRGAWVRVFVEDTLYSLCNVPEGNRP